MVPRLLHTGEPTPARSLADLRVAALGAVARRGSHCKNRRVAGTFEELFARYSKPVYRRALKLLSDADAAKDVLQEVFLKLLSREGSAESISNPMAWIYQVTTNHCLNILRDNKRRDQLLSAEATFSAELDSAETRAIVHRILDRVDPELQSCAVYYYVDELSHEEIAEILGVSRRTIGNRIASFHAAVEDLLLEER